MRNADDVYWTTSLPKNHQALQMLDAYCQEWGGLSRAEATRRLLIEWDKLRRGEVMTAWTPQNAARSVLSGQPEWTQQAVRGENKPTMSNRKGIIANQSLDDE